MTLEHLLTLPDNANAVAVTFDDGLETFAEKAWPLLRERDIPVTLFVVTEAVGTDNRWPDDRSSGIPKLRLLDWNELGKLAGEGVTIGSHTRTHVRLTNADAAVIARLPVSIMEQVAGCSTRTPISGEWRHRWTDRRGEHSLLEGRG